MFLMMQTCSVDAFLAASRSCVLPPVWVYFSRLRDHREESRSPAWLETPPLNDMKLLLSIAGSRNWSVIVHGFIGTFSKALHLTC